jgi:hypothetical protein
VRFAEHLIVGEVVFPGCVVGQQRKNQTRSVVGIRFISV